MSHPTRERLEDTTDTARLDLHPGDIVKVRMDAGNIIECRVRAAPWMLYDETWVIGLEGITGGYLLSRVVSVTRRTNG